ncbi:hypothetical protein T11_9458 [Trichinella zimbabwensis]|uniref:Uncharacterized protein n=1 Tax=Trichinella zimbabwensis TaxID=268475 RepID=A0A0V1GBJ1_9BILA|nr:hypothetical protein T11_9458 [Trichinella zimbabwensis]
MLFRLSENVLMSNHCQLKLGMATANLLASKYLFNFRLTVL